MLLQNSGGRGVDCYAARMVAFVLLGASILLGLASGWMLVRDLARVKTEHALIQDSDRLLSAIKDLETGHRGYVIAGTSDYLDPYMEARSVLPSLHEKFRKRAIAGNIAQPVIDRIAETIGKKMEFAEDGVKLRRDESRDAALEHVASNVGKGYMDDLRKDLSEVEAKALSDIDDRYNPNIITSVMMLTGALAGLVLAAGYFLMIARLARRRNAWSAELVAEIIDNAPVGLALIDPQGVMRASNAAFAQIVGRAEDNIDARPFREVAPDLHDKIRGRIMLYNVIQRSREQPSTSTVRINDGGRSTDVEVKLFPVSLDDRHGQAGDGVGIVMQDITRQKQWARDLEKARDAADAANRAKSAFIANMSHELRTPLTAVLGYCELLEDEMGDLDQPQLLADLNKISVNAKHLLGLINDVLDLSKIEAERMDVHAVPFHTRQLLAEIESAVGSLVAKKNNRLSLRIGRIEPEMNTDDLKLRQILLNLLSNAAKFTDNGDITLKVEPDVREGVPVTRFSVIDTGLGMTEEQLANLFQRFKQADETTTRKFGGTGLGLALTQALTTMLGGKVDVISTHGSGSTFSVEIPNIFVAPTIGPSAAVAARQAMHGEVPEAGATPGSVILVIDDDASQRDLLTRQLTREGFAVVTAENGPDGIAKAQALMPAAVLLDVMMPGMNGWHVMRELRNNPATADLPIIVQTVLDEESFAYSLGATDYLKKPVDRLRLSELLKDLQHRSPGDYVLVIDDDESVRSALAEMFKRDDWEVVEAANGKQGLVQIGARLPTLVVVDLLMPVMDGYQFVTEVRKNPAWANLPIVVLTSEDLSKQSVRELMAKTSQVVQKGSVSLTELVGGLKNLTNTRPSAETVTATDGNGSEAEN